MLWFYGDLLLGTKSTYRNFNTSHVMVLSGSFVAYKEDAIIFQYISCYGSIGISSSAIIFTEQFQYISCYGSIKYITKKTEDRKISIHLMLWFYINNSTIKGGNITNFNTSHVMVLLNNSTIKGGNITNFNTSHVMVLLSRC